nr:MAG: nucleocapsid protein [Cockroach phenui-like virus 2]
MKFDDRIHSDGKTDYTSFDQMEQYILASWNNQIYTDDARHEFMVELGIVNRETGQLMPEVATVCEAASQEYDARRAATATTRGMRMKATGAFKESCFAINDGIDPE